MREQGLLVTAWDARLGDEAAVDRLIAAHRTRSQTPGAFLIRVEAVVAKGFELAWSRDEADAEFGDDHWEIRPCPDKVQSHALIDQVIVKVLRPPARLEPGFGDT